METLIKLQEQVLANCLIAEANYAGTFSLCGLVLRLRDLFKWEKGLLPWAEPEPSVLLEWIEHRESSWDPWMEKNFQPLVVNGMTVDPFDVEAVNDLLAGTGMVYGAGFVEGLRPSFFLGTIEETWEIDGAVVFVVAEELVRDVFAAPAMRQGPRIYIRRQPMLAFLWDQIFEMRPSARSALAFAFAVYDLNVADVARNPARYADQLKTIARNQLHTWIYHELGEFHEEAFRGHMWHDIVASYSNTPIEIYARVLKDLCADTDDKGLLTHIIEDKNRAALAFYVAFLRPFTRLMFPEILKAFQKFKKFQNWELIEAARQQGKQKFHEMAAMLVALHQEHQHIGIDRARDKILERCIAPLGLLKKATRPDAV
ncbi:MAG: Sfum_1244 family protein [Desulfosoma sp.]